jgi:uncharacterized protein YbjT (DUF2867 family)
VRSGWFNQNFSEGIFLDSILSGELALPVGGVGEPFIDTDDIADVAVAALTEEGHDGETYEVTGPRLLTFAEAVEEIARASGRDITFREISPDEFAAGLAALEYPADIISLMRYLFVEVLDGRNAYLTDGVQRALGRRPRDFAAYARETAASGVWTAGA